MPEAVPAYVHLASLPCPDSALMVSQKVKGFLFWRQRQSPTVVTCCHLRTCQVWPDGTRSLSLLPFERKMVREGSAFAEEH